MERTGEAKTTNPEDMDLMKVFRDLRVVSYRDEGNFMYCPTGEPYMTVASAGIKPEGAKTDLFDSERKAFDAWNDTIREVVKGVDRTLMGENEGKLTVYWRRKPEMKYLEPYRLLDKDESTEEWLSDTKGFSTGRWTVYSRFRISVRPVIQSADYNEIYPTRGEGLPDVVDGRVDI